MIVSVLMVLIRYGYDLLELTQIAYASHYLWRKTQTPMRYV